jgi:DNA-binding response OmpR family regulator
MDKGSTIMNQKKILVVDDDVIIVNRLMHALSAAGYSVLTAIDGSAAVSIVRHEKPDLILLDITFPPDVAHGGGVAWDGFTIIEWLHRMDEVKGVPIIVITGSEAEKYRTRSLAAGAAGFFRKPINHAELLTTVRGILGEGSPASGSPAA